MRKRRIQSSSRGRVWGGGDEEMGRSGVVFVLAVDVTGEKPVRSGMMRRAKTERIGWK